MISLPLSALLDLILPALPKQVPIFLVGGAVRDALLNHTSHDLDFVVDGNARKVARAVANSLHAAYYPLNDTIDAGRVLYTLPLDQPEGGPSRRYILDFCSLRGDNIETDLIERDFTINAIALDLSTRQLIDPLHGGRDLHEKTMRACSEKSFISDPVRVLRAVRLADQLGFQIDPASLGWLREAVPMLPGVTAERLREEIMRILGGTHPERAMRILAALRILPQIMPEITALDGVEQSPPHIYDVMNHTFSLLAKLSALLDTLSPGYSPDGETGYSSNLILGMAAARLGRFRSQIGEHFAVKDYPETNRRALLFLAALYHDSGKALNQQRAKNGRILFYHHDQTGADLVSQRAHALHMSNDDDTYLQTVIQNHMRPFLLYMRGERPTRRAIYRYFRATGPAGVDICLMALADYLATYDYTISQTPWGEFLDVICTLLDNWWHRQEENIAPPALVDGYDLISLFGLKPGPLIGELLEQVREGQASGEIHSQSDAFKKISKWLAEKKATDPQDNESRQSGSHPI